MWHSHFVLLHLERTDKKTTWKTRIARGNKFTTRLHIY